MSATNPKYFTVGPSQLNPRFEEFLRRAMDENIGSISHRGERFQRLHADLDNNLKKLFAVPETYSVFYAGSATEFMERVIQNVSVKNTLHFVVGAFSKKFLEIAVSNGRSAVSVPVGAGGGTFSLGDIPADANPELVCATHNETSNGTVLSRDFLDSLRAKFPEALIALDIVSSAPVSDVDLAATDCAFFSVQKGFGLPAGLGVMFVSPAAMARARQIESDGAQYTGSFHSFTSFAKYAEKHQTPETPNVLGMYLLNEACLDFLEKGRAVLMSETEKKAEVIYKTLQESSRLHPVIQDVKARSRTVIVAAVDGGSKDVLEKMKAKGFVLGAGYGDKKELQVRIGNFPSHSMEDVLAMCAELRQL
jgi:phosphoserine aminotransferase